MSTEQAVKQEQTLSTEKIQELATMQRRIVSSIENDVTREKVKNDFTYTFGQLGLVSDEAETLCDQLFVLLLSGKHLPEIEEQALLVFENIKLKVGDQERNLIEVLHDKLRDRAMIITSQVSPHLEDVKGKIIDYGAGDGQVTQMLHDQFGADIEGVDIRLYKTSNVTVPIRLFNGGYVEATDGAYEAALLTNVLHHEKFNEKILNELDRIVTRRLVILETVPIGVSEEEMEQDKDRTFMNDYLYNRLFHSADVPVPGSFETPKKWVERLAQHGWKITSEQDLGFDQPTIKDRHYLFVFEK